MSPSKRLLPLTLTLLILVLDRVTKNLVDATMSLHQSIPVLGDTLRLTYIHNLGTAFSLDFITARPLGYLSLFPIAILIWLVVASRAQTAPMRWTLAGILGGAVGNTFDRIRYGYVIDFVDVDLPDALMERWPVFNVADMAVSVGVVLLMLMIIFEKKILDPEPEMDDAPQNAAGTEDDGGNTESASEQELP